MTGAERNKTKIARRVIEVLDYLDSGRGEITVMDIVRSFHRPQSSTSELLASLVELGLFHKDPIARTYRVMPRAAFIGQSCQPQSIRDGRIVRLVETLHSQTGYPVTLNAIVGVSAQIVAVRGTGDLAARKSRFQCGAKDPLAFSAVGQMLLSAMPQPRRGGVLRRLNAEAEQKRKFATAEMDVRIAAMGERQFAIGPAGFGNDRKALALLVPGQPDDRPLAIGLVLPACEKTEPAPLLEQVRSVLTSCLGIPEIGQPDDESQTVLEMRSVLKASA